MGAQAEGWGDGIQASCLVNRHWLEDVPGGQPIVLGDQVLREARCPPTPNSFSLSTSRAPFPDHPGGSSEKNKKQLFLELIPKGSAGAKGSGRGPTGCRSGTEDPVLEAVGAYSEHVCRL